MANEIATDDWRFPTPDMTTIHQNTLLIYCDANPSSCPESLARSRSQSSGLSGSGSLYDPSATAAANNLSVIITGDDNSLSLATDQQSENDSVRSLQSGDATIDNQEVLNIGR